MMQVERGYKLVGSLLVSLMVKLQGSLFVVGDRIMQMCMTLDRKME